MELELLEIEIKSIIKKDFSEIIELIFTTEREIRSHPIDGEFNILYSCGVKSGEDLLRMFYGEGIEFFTDVDKAYNSFIEQFKKYLILRIDKNKKYNLILKKPSLENHTLNFPEKISEVSFKHKDNGSFQGYCITCKIILIENKNE